MIRRRLSLLVLVLAAYSVAACSSPTAPKAKQGCQVVSGVHTCT
jgi:hypothetical protein